MFNVYLGGNYCLLKCMLEVDNVDDVIFFSRRNYLV